MKTCRCFWLFLLVVTAWSTNALPARAQATAAVARINCGGGAFTDSQGNAWSADAFSGGGSTYFSGNPIAGTVDDTLYQSERFGNFTYQVPVPTSGTYEVVLHAAEIYWTSAGARVFNVLAEGSLIVSNLDLWGSAGALTALQLRRPVPVSDGFLNLQFVTLVDNAKISAIEVLSGTNGVVTPPPAPLLTVLPVSLSFGAATVGSTSAVQTVAIGNGGTASLTVTNVSLAGAQSGNFRLTQGAPFVLAPGVTTTVSVAFAPALTGSLAATVVVSSTAPTGTVNVPLSGTGTAVIPPPPALAVARINCGGGAFTDSQGHAWSADAFSGGGSTYFSVNPIAGTVDDTLYQSERFGNFTYQVPVPTSGTYEVVLHAAEIYWTSAGARVFNVLAEGSLIVSNLDLWGSAGALTALQLRRPVPVSDGFLNLQFVTLVDNAKISAIEVLSGTNGVVSPPPAPLLTVLPVSLNFGAVTVGSTSAVQTVAIGNGGTASLTVTNVSLAGAQSGNYRLTQGAPFVLAPGVTTTVSVAFAPALTGSLAATVVVSSTAPAGTVNVPLSGTGTAVIPPPPALAVARINCGGGAFTDSQGNAWSADAFSGGGSTYFSGNPIAGAVDDTLYQSERFGNFTYQVPVPTSGTYEVVLHAAEIYWTSAGARVFNVLAEGSLIVSNLDLWGAAGALTALQLRRPVPVSDGFLNLQFVTLADNAKISAIEVLGSTNTVVVPPAALLTVNPSALAFGPVAVGTTGAVQTVAIGNSGTASLTVSDVALGGGNASHYRLTQNVPYTLAPGQTTIVSVVFAPAVGGPLPGSLLVESTAPGGPATVGLSGVGSLPAPPVQGIAIYRVNCGGGAWTDTEGAFWDSDAGRFNIGGTYSITEPIAGTEHDFLYQSERWDGVGAPEMTYSFPVPPGDYLVRLHFAEIYSGAAATGVRVFGIQAESQLLVTNLDVFAEAGFRHALVKTMAASCTDGNLDITFVHGTENPKVSAIEILVPRAEVIASPLVIDWGHVSVGTTSHVERILLVNTSSVPANFSTLTFRVNAGVGRAFVATINGTAYHAGEAGATHAVNVVLPAGTTQAIDVVYQPEAEGDGDVWLDMNGNFTTQTARLRGTGGDSHGHPFLHVVINVPAFVVDYDGNGVESVRLDGNGSHTHEFGHMLARYEWREAGLLFSTNLVVDRTYGLGTHAVSLTVLDDHVPPETLSDTASFSVVPPTAIPGSLVQYYNAGATNPEAWLAAVPAHADYAERIDGMRLEATAGHLGRSPFTGPVLVVISAALSVTNAGTYAFSLTGGTSSRLLVDNVLYAGPMSLPAGEHLIEARFAVSSPSASALEVQMGPGGGNLSAIPQGQVTHDEAGMAPVLNTMPTIGLPTGGYPISITGLGFVPPAAVVVHWGTQTVQGVALQVSPEMLTLEVPPSAVTGVVGVVVETPAGVSRTVNFLYSETGPAPVVFTNNPPIPTTAPTQAVWGPDGRLYVGSVYGTIVAMTFDDSYNVVSQQFINTIGNLPNPNILGLAFNPHDPPGSNVLYVAHNLLHAHGGGCFDEYAEYNGEISILRGPSFAVAESLITGLPVSNHDHGVSGITFDSNGDLLLTVGGNSNAGVPGCNMGALPESPLSACIAKAHTSRPGFNGTITYVETATGQPNMDQRDGAIVDMVPGTDVNVFASGFRNAFDLVLTTRGQLYATDNGPNPSFGPESTSATTEGPDPYDDDTLNLVEQGHYYGHPNRNRGRKDGRQNVYRGIMGPSIPQVFSQAIFAYLPSVNGIDEYRAQTFNGALRGELILQRWNWQTLHVVLTNDGRTVASSGVLPVQLKALDVTMGPGGVVIGANYSENCLIVAQPVDSAAIGLTVYDIFPWRAPATGGHTFTIGGSGFGTLANTTVTIGGTQAVLTSVSPTRIRGIIPARVNPRRDLLDVVVTAGVQTRNLPDAFRYLLPVGQENSARATMSVNANSTYESGSIRLRNDAGSGQTIERLVVDLRTALLPDVVFDPTGAAGDTTGKGFTVDINPGVGVLGHSFSSPHDGGFDVLTIDFSGFMPGMEFGFSVDIDPTSVQGAATPGPGDSGSVSGMALTGTRGRVTFNDGTEANAPLIGTSVNLFASVGVPRAEAPEAPVLALVGVGGFPAVTGNSNHTARVTGPAGSTVDVFVVEAALYTNGLAGGGFDVDPFEANRVIQAALHVAVIGVSGTVEVPVTLRRSNPDGGYVYVVAAVRDALGVRGDLAGPLVLRYLPAGGPGGSAPLALADAARMTVADVPPLQLALKRSGESAGALEVSWSSAAGQRYIVYESTNLLGNWIPVSTVEGSGALLSYPARDDVRAVFYRIEAQDP